MPFGIPLFALVLLSLLVLYTVIAGEGVGLALAQTQAQPIRHHDGVSNFLDASPLRARALNAPPIRVTTQYSQGHIFALQLTCCIIAGISLLAGLVISYWFLQMHKAFRHWLIFILMISDINRSIWFFVFPLVNFIRGPVSSASRFCQASGFFTQFSYELNDGAILALAIHTAIQVFRPQPLALGQGGLYRVRKWVYALLIFFPILSASLAFINKPLAYQSQGVVCALPIRPFWFRLALSWIPRYLILIVIVSLYIAIYIHAGHELAASKLFQRRRGRRRESTWAGDQRHGALDPAATHASRFWRAFLSSRQRHVDELSRHPSQGPDEKDREFSCGTTLVGSDTTRNASACKTSPTFAPLQMPTASAPPLRARAESPDARSPRNTFQISSMPGAARRLSRLATMRPVETDEMRKKRHAIRRQLRLLFVYPVVYFLMWLPAFANHCLAYSDRFAHHPVFSLTVITFACIASMGLADFAIFSVRERPWTHIPGSDGTILGSFLFWRYDPTRRISKAYGGSSATPITPDTAPRPSMSADRQDPWYQRRGAIGVDCEWNNIDLIPSLGPGHEGNPTLTREIYNRIDNMMSWRFESGSQTSRPGDLEGGRREEEEVEEDG